LGGEIAVSGGLVPATTEAPLPNARPVSQPNRTRTTATLAKNDRKNRILKALGFETCSMSLFDLGRLATIRSVVYH
jgi:hypothetical protein